MKQAQISLEFIMMVGIAVLVTAVFIVILNDVFTDSVREKNQEAVNDFAYAIQSEIILANRAEPGYVRVWTLPPTLHNHPYSIENTNTTFTIWYDNNKATLTLPIPLINGTLVNDTMIIRNINGTVHIT